MGLPGVNEVGGSGFLLRSSPLPSPGFQPASAPSPAAPPSNLVLPPSSQTIPVNCSRARSGSSPSSSPTSASVSPSSPLVPHATLAPAAPRTPNGKASTGAAAKEPLRRVRSLGDALQYDASVLPEPRRFLSG